jgi:hypothetical protein
MGINIMGMVVPPLLPIGIGTKGITIGFRILTTLLLLKLSTYW